MCIAGGATSLALVEFHDSEAQAMTDTLTLSPHRVVSSFTAVLVAIALVGMLALGFGVRVWTEHTPRPAAPAGEVHRVAPGPAPQVCRIGRPC
ncbi:MAG: hypothetical protein JWL83_2471 [Actinomycetia bacterium]|nr:hypothetical protein [Actinomycetes bacterium]